MNLRNHRIIAILLIVAIFFSITPEKSSTVYAANARIRPWRAIRWAALNLTPAGKVAKPFIDRQNAYRTADRWLSDKRATLSQRQETLVTMYKNREIDAHTYIKYKALTLRMENQYKEAQSSMKGIAHDKFGKDFMQVFVDQIAPRILKSARFTETMREVNETFTTTQKVMKDGLNALEELKAKMYPEFMRNGREKLEEVMKKMDERGIRGGMADDLYGKLQQVVGELKRLEKDVPEALTPKEVKQMSAEVKDAAEQLGKIQKQMNDGVNQLKDQGTVRIPAGGKGKAAELSSQLQAIRDMEKLTELDKVMETAGLYEEFGSGIAQKLAELGLEPTDGNYGKIRAQMIEAISKVNPKNRTDKKIEELFKKIASDVTGEDLVDAEEDEDEETDEVLEPTATIPPPKKIHLTVGTDTFVQQFGMSWQGLADNIAPGEPLCKNHGIGSLVLDDMSMQVEIDLIENKTEIKISGISKFGSEGFYSGEYGTDKAQCSFSGVFTETEYFDYDPVTREFVININGNLDVTCNVSVFCGYDPSLERAVWAVGQDSASNPIRIDIWKQNYDDCQSEITLITDLDKQEEKIWVSSGSGILDSEKCKPLNWVFE